MENSGKVEVVNCNGEMLLITTMWHYCQWGNKKSGFSLKRQVFERETTGGKEVQLWVWRL
jgi:hypothetical protein